jgi:hypothetical protein
MAKKSRNQLVLVEKIPEPWPPITNGPCQLPTLQWPLSECGEQAQIPESGRGTARGFFLTRPEGIFCKYILQRLIKFSKNHPALGLWIRVEKISRMSPQKYNFTATAIIGNVPAGEL